MKIEEWLNGNQLSIDIWKNKYQYNGEDFEQWLDRVSGGDSTIRELIKEKKFLFGGRILANRGINNRKLSLSNCYVLEPPEDNLESIFECGKKLARTFSYGGGCGIDISKLAPRGATIHNAAKSTTGAVSFMDFFSYITGLIGQEGRRGALMISIDCSHPDLEDFINLKSNLDTCTKANISVRISDDFMNAVIDDSKWTLSYYRPESDETITKEVNARDIFKLLALRNWEMAEPGILYWDTISNYNILDHDPSVSYAGVNPCAEEPLISGSSCLLGSINLSEFVKNPFTNNSYIDFTALGKAVHSAVDGLNQVLDEGLPLHPLEEQRNSVRDYRQIGLGTMGLADMLIKLGLKYGSDKAIEIIDKVFKFIANEALLESSNLAESNSPYSKYNSIAINNSDFINNVADPAIKKCIISFGLRNSQLLTCAPTGSIATMLQVSTGIEPNYAFEFNRRTVSLNKEETTYKVYAPIVDLYREITNNNGDLPEYFIASQEIAPIDRIKMQATVQKYIDASISSTINLPESATVDDVYNIYIEAWKNGLKGVTVFRDNCQRQGILSTKEETRIDEIPRGFVVKADDNCIGLKRSLVTGCGTLHCEAFFDPITGELRETYLSKGSKGGCNNFMIGLSRMISLAARGGLSIEAIIDQLKSCGTCPSYAVRCAVKKDTSKGSCCPVAVGNALMDMYKEVLSRIACCGGIQLEAVHTETIESYNECPQCHEKGLIHTNGCVQCTSCGWSKCN